LETSTKICQFVDVINLL